MQNVKIGDHVMSQFDIAHMNCYLCFMHIPFSRCSELFIKSLQFSQRQRIFGTPLEVTALKYRQEFWRQKTRIYGLSCGVICVTIRLGRFVELRLVADTRTHAHRVIAYIAI